MPRTERDSLGAKSIPSRAYYGIQTHRAVENFQISGLRLHPEMRLAFAYIKKAAAITNARLGLLEQRLARAIVNACDELIAGRFDDQFVVDVYQAGAGTSFNMNVNEVIANRANELLGAPKGSYRYVHPNDHVNMGQSTNDTIPTAIRLAALMTLPALLASLDLLEGALRLKARQFESIVKSGRTHLQDAVPVFLGREFGAWALMVKKSRERIAATQVSLAELNLGGTAAGTGMNAHPRYRKMAIALIRQWTKLPLRPADDMMERMQSVADFAHLSSTVRTYCLDLVKIANDLRLLNSGPNTGLAEIELPAVQPGSSIMPGKVNPVMPEMITMVCFQAVGHDATIALAAQAGQLELNVMMPVLAYNLLQELHIVANGTATLATKCVRGITANRARAATYAHRSVSLVTALAPRLGYAHAAKIAKLSLSSRRPIVELVVEQGLLPRREAERLLDPVRLAGSKRPERV